jgi:hypothetical protein
MIYKPLNFLKMKASKVFLIVLLAVGVSSSFQARSQAEVIFDNVVTFTDGNGEVFESIDSRITLSASGKIMKTATFQLPQDNYLVPEKGISYIGAIVKQTNVFGEEVIMYDVWVEITKSGRFKLVVHSNGAGVNFPAVFKDYIFE